jgi:transcription antitermination protein NusB
VKTRTRARGWALQLLYARESSGRQTSLGEVLDDFLRARRIRPASLEYVRRLATTIDAHGDEIDSTLQGALQNWTLRRLSAIDRNVLRVGAAELLFHSDVPPRAAIQEAILLAEKYGTTESPRFVNGVLDAVMRGQGKPGSALREGRH